MADPPLPAGFTLDAPPSASPNAPALPAGFTADAPAKIQPQGYVTVGQFGDDPNQGAHPLPADVEKNVVNILATHPIATAAEDARAYLRPMGITPNAATNGRYRDSFDQVIAWRKTHGTVSDSVINQLMTPEEAAKLEGTQIDAGGAAVRGAAGMVAPVNTIDSFLHATADTLNGKGASFTDNLHRWEDVNYSIQHGDETEHPDARLVGQIIGGLAIPSGYEGEALNAGKSVLRSGGTMTEARAAAKAAARTRLAIEGGAVGASHGFDTAAPGQGTVGAIEGGAMGAAGGYGLAAAGQAAAPLVPKVSEAVSKVGDLIPAKAPDATPNYADLADELGIRQTPATNSKSGISTAVQGGLAVLPGGFPIGNAAQREVSDLGTAAHAVASDVGPVGTRQEAGQAVAEGAQGYSTKSKTAGNALYRERDSLVGGQNAPVPTPNAKAAIDDIAAKFPNSPEIQALRQNPIIGKIENALPGQPQEVPTGVLDANGNPITKRVEQPPLTLGEATEALSAVRQTSRDLIRNGAAPTVISRVNALKRGLTQDVMEAARQADVAAGREPGAEGSALKAQQDADKFWADRSQALNGALKKPLASAADPTKVSGEAVYNQILGDMSATKGNLARLRSTWFRLPDSAKKIFAATAIDDLGRARSGAQNDAGDGWSFQTFLTNRDSLSPQARNIVFGQKADAQLDKIAAYASRLRDLDKMRNYSNTAQRTLAGLFMGALGLNLLHGNLAGAGEELLFGGLQYGAAKLFLSTAGMRGWTSAAMRAATTSAPNAETTAKVLTRRLSTIAQSEPTIANDVLALQQRLMDAFGMQPMKAAASDKKDSGQKPR